MGRDSRRPCCWGVPQVARDWNLDLRPGRIPNGVAAQAPPCVSHRLEPRSQPAARTELAAAHRAGTPALQQPPLHVMLPICCLTAPTQGLDWRAFDLCSKAPAIRTRSVSVRSTDFQVLPGGRLLFRSVQGVVISRETRRNVQKIHDLAPLGDDPEACYADRIPQFRTLCGSIQVLLYAKART